MQLAQQVILFVIDGLRPDALQQVHTPKIDKLVTEGAYTWQAQTIMPSITLPCFASMFCAVPPVRHGIVSNVWTPSQPSVPSLLEIVHQAGLGTAAFYTWEPLRDLGRPGALDFAYFHREAGPDAVEREQEIGKVASEYIAEHQPAFAFVYIAATDLAGHAYGWMSDTYLQAVSLADRTVGMVLDRVRAAGGLEETACLVLADHGGHDHAHSAGLAEDLTIPWIISGAGIRHGYSITRPVSIMDTAPTIAHLLGLPTPVEWSGRVVTEVLAS